MRALEPVDITLYLDMFFLVNSLMDLLLLDLMKHFLKLPCKMFRLIGAAMAGGLGASVMLLAYVCCRSVAGEFLWMAVSVIIIPAWMIFLAFGRSRAADFGKRMAALYFLGALAGGILCLADGPGMAGWYLSGTTMAKQWALLPFFLWSAGMYFLLRALEQKLRRWRQEQDVLCRVTLLYRGQCQTVTALWDTGNHLYEPYSHQPVHVITEEACRTLCKTVNQVAYIPFRAVGTGYGLLPGIRIDGMDVLRKGRPVRHYDRPWLAVSKGPLSVGRHYEMLLHGEEQE